MQGCKRGVAPQWLMHINHSNINHRFSKITRMHALSVQLRCSFIKLNSTSGIMRKKKLTMRKAQAVPVIRLSGKRMIKGKQFISSYYTFAASFIGKGSSSATTGAFLAMSSKFIVLSSPFFFAYSPCPYLYFYAPSSPVGSSNFLTIFMMTTMRKSKTMRKQRKMVPRWQFCPWVDAIIQISLEQSRNQIQLNLFDHINKYARQQYAVRSTSQLVECDKFSGIAAFIDNSMSVSLTMSICFTNYSESGFLSAISSPSIYFYFYFTRHKLWLQNHFLQLYSNQMIRKINMLHQSVYLQIGFFGKDYSFCS